jgi:serine/threonine protein kinase/Tol biopolymer transport system component
MITKMLSRYEILTPIGEGGMGVVYRAIDTRLGRPVAVKLLRSAGLMDGESRKRLVHEARAASALNHPHIITIYDIELDHGADFIAMEYVTGRSLAHLLAQSRLRIEESLTYACQIADALAAAHAAGILHRDLKPANIMVTDKGSIKVLDFGLAKLTRSSELGAADDGATFDAVNVEDSVQTAEGTILGTAAYMSPEQAEGKPADARSDVFSFGTVLYEMVTGRRAFKAGTNASTLAAVLTTEPDPPSKGNPRLSPDLEKTIVRCLRKNPERRWQSMADLKVALEDLREEFDAARLSAPAVSQTYRSRRALQVGLGIGAIGALLLGGWWITHRTPEIGDAPFLTRLTSDVGWTDYPAISPDGKILAFASDRSGDGNLDIWVQPVHDGAPVRMTHHAADDIAPSISADGSRVAFQSSRDGGGVYVIPTLGGEERLIAAHGFSPRFSPDGQWIAYGVAEHAGSKLYVAPAAGGPATPVAASFYRVQSHVWSPDGRYLLFWAQRNRDAPPENNTDWYVASIPGGSPVATRARIELLRAGFEAVQGLPFPNAWVSAGNRIVFHGHVGDSSNMWQIAIDPATWQITSAPRRATFGTTDEAAASVTSDGRMAFISRTMGADIWSLPIDTDHAKVTGPLKRLTQDAADDYDPTLSSDGATLVFRSRRSGRFDVVLKKLETGAETVLTRVPEDHYPAISPDGNRVAYSFRQQSKMPIFIMPAAGGTPDLACDDCGEVEGWSPDGTQILYLTAHDPSGIGVVKIGGPRNDGWLKHSSYGLYNARFSSDDWVVFNGRTDRLSPPHVLVAKVQGSNAAREQDWIVVSRDGEAPGWSPDARSLYFWSERDGSPCLWVQHVDAATKQPIGEPQAVQHFHTKGLSLTNLYGGAPDIAVGRDKIVFNLGEHTGNIWMTNLSK